MSSSPPPAVDAPPRRRRLLWLTLGLFAVLLLGLGVLGYFWYARDRALREALAEADRLDPGWRLAELEAARAAVPDAENAALQVQAADALLPKPWLPPLANGGSEQAEVDRKQPSPGLGEATSREVRSGLQKVVPALTAARRLAKMPHGRYPVKWSADGLGTLMPHLEQVHRVALLLRLDAALRANDGDMDGALTSCWAMLNTGRSLGDEPALVSQRGRLICQRSAMTGLEFALARGEPSEVDLAEMQRALEEEEKESLEVIAARGERAGIHQFLEVMEAGRFDRATYNIRSPSGSYQVDNLVDATRAQAAHAAYLRYLTEVVEITKMPPEQQVERLHRPGLEPPRDVPPLLAALTEGGKDFPAPAFHANRGLLRCAAAGLAAERYRRAHGRWPDGLEALVPDYLSAVPANPFDGRPLVYRRLPDGVVLEAPGESKPEVAFRLWDADRRQPPEE
jgi:hypothetical protein